MRKKQVVMSPVNLNEFSEVGHRRHHPHRRRCFTHPPKAARMAGGYWAVPGGKFEKGEFLQSCKELVESKDV